MVLLRCCLAAILIIQVVFGLGSYKSVTVKGQVGCGDYEVSNVTVELWEKDRGLYNICCKIGYFFITRKEEAKIEEQKNKLKIC